MTLTDLLGAHPGAFLLLTVVMFGLLSALTGQMLAEGWRPQWQVVPWTLLLGLGDRFLHFAMFKGELWHVSGYITHTLWMLFVAFLAFRWVRARKMARQYPWKIELAGPFSWREKQGR
ncbi:MAG: hypothetical protein EAZ99_02420 [Alphaproteobacteria bacterium]|nr:hypothetical protein [Alphaproteobacteria bacterium]TAD91524.1 MAG: hypothetical protein EAZ99_02420 [Alphaproteobacteria bacterium]